MNYWLVWIWINPAACIDGHGGAFWARRGTEPKMQCSCLSILFAMIFGEYVSQGPFFQGDPKYLLGDGFIQGGSLDLWLLDRCSWL